MTEVGKIFNEAKKDVHGYKEIADQIGLLFSDKKILPFLKRKNFEIGKDILFSVDPRRDWFIVGNKNLENLSADDFNAANEINLTGSFLLSRATSSKMKAGASIVMFASMYGIVSPNPSLYPDGINPNPIEYGAHIVIHSLTN